ncbi:MAG TPA: hypothetical protein VJT49_14790 [Amycolatopsis sp.]|uniref:hypothetical protein n=1 Tax=Amycolatopsis sp. TaxID=37632 RepID=UPI002B478E58|nr:hypothetical protein [Amycolatopsis sp.]HKS46345.1 hypothetical protein [Amycolatopsis sp.]
MKYVVSAPVADFTGKIGSVMVVDGKAEVDTSKHIAEYGYFRSAGYQLDLLGESDDTTTEAASSEDEPPKPYAGKPEWVAWAVKQGADPDAAKAASKPELIDQYGPK